MVIKLTGHTPLTHARSSRAVSYAHNTLLRLNAETHQSNLTVSGWRIGSKLLQYTYDRYIIFIGMGNVVFRSFSIGHLDRCARQTDTNRHKYTRVTYWLRASSNSHASRPALLTSQIEHFRPWKTVVCTFVTFCRDLLSVGHVGEPKAISPRDQGQRQ